MFVELTKITTVPFNPVDKKNGSAGEYTKESKILVNKNNILFLENTENNGCKITFCNGLYITVKENYNYIKFITD